MKNSSFYYSIGALLYCPANNKTVANSIVSGRFVAPFSLALCLEDTISDNFVAEAECILCETISAIYNALNTHDFYLPKIFIRVRNHEQIPKLTKLLGPHMKIITGYIIPKFCLKNADSYINEITHVNEHSDKPVYMLPIYESSDIIDTRTRYDILYRLKDKIDTIEDRILNIRVGGNDLCNIFGFRRNAYQSIHQIKPISDIFSDIITVYGIDYVVSGPVWEYFNGNHWDCGLKSEIADDLLCGFIGKTAIHPKQIPIINHMLAVDKSDFESAKSILNWSKDSHSLVSSDPTKERMNEYKTHANWANKIMYMSEYFGIK